MPSEISTYIFLSGFGASPWAQRLRGGPPLGTPRVCGALGGPRGPQGVLKGPSGSNAYLRRLSRYRNSVFPEKTVGFEFRDLTYLTENYPPEAGQVCVSQSISMALH